jgi:hypothetical protein
MKEKCDIYKTDLCYYYRESSKDYRGCHYKDSHNVICIFDKEEVKLIE